jgi:hypothetical protein
MRKDNPAQSSLQGVLSTHSSKIDRSAMRALAREEPAGAVDQCFKHQFSWRPREAR